MADRRTSYIQNKVYEEFGLSDPTIYDEFLRRDDGQMDFLIFNFLSQKAVNGRQWSIAFYKTKTDEVEKTIVIEFRDVVRTVEVPAVPAPTSAVGSDDELEQPSRKSITVKEKHVGGKKAKKGKAAKAAAEHDDEVEIASRATVTTMEIVEQEPYEKQITRYYVKTHLFAIASTDIDEKLSMAGTLFFITPIKEMKPMEWKSMKGPLDMYFECFHICGNLLESLALLMNQV